MEVNKILKKSVYESYTLSLKIDMYNKTFLLLNTSFEYGIVLDEIS